MTSTRGIGDCTANITTFLNIIRQNVNTFDLFMKEDVKINNPTITSI